MNEIFHANTHVHFGAIVYISCFKDYSNFYLCSSSITFKTLIYIGETQGPIDPNMCLFTVCPPIKFQSEQFLRNILQNRYLDDGEMAEYDEKKAKVFIDQFQFQLKQNNNIKEQQIKFPIKYNQSFMLQHKFSAKYLCFVKDPETNQYNLQLSDIPAINCVFNLKACFNYQKDVNTYIPFNSAANLTAKLHDGLQVRQLCLQLNNHSVFDSWILSQQISDKIRFGLYQTGDELEYKNISYGDSVWIFHLESGSFVKILQENFTEGNILLDKVKYRLGFLKQKEDKIEKMSQIVVQKSENELSAEKFGLWKIISGKNKQKFKGGRVKYDEEVRFYNVRYNSYLGVRKVKLGRNKYEYAFCIEEHQQLNTVFSLKSLSSSSQFVTTEDLFLIKNLLTNTYMTLTQSMQINQLTATLTPSDTYKKEDNFKLTTIDYLQEWQNNYLLSILPFIEEGINQLKESSHGESTQRGEVILKLLSENLIEMLSFSYDLTEGFEASESKLGKMTYNHFMVQKLLREQGIMDKLIQILDIIKPDKLLNFASHTSQSSINKNLKMIGLAKIVKKFSVGIKQGDDRKFKLEEGLYRRIIDTSLKILRNCCKSNIENSLYSFKFLKIFVKYLGMGTYAQNMMMQAFQNNQILLSMSSDEFTMIINQYVKINKKTNRFSPKIFEFLSKFLQTSEKTISKNQLQLYRLLSINQSLIVPIQEVDSNFIVRHQKVQVELNQFCAENRELSSYIAQQIRFYAQLCSDRNYVCSKTIKRLFPISTVYKYIHSKDTSEKLIQAFLWILMNVYLNERPRFKAQHPLIFSIPMQIAMQESEEEIPQFQKEIRLMKTQGLSQQSIDDIISCIHQADSMTQNHLIELQDLIINQIQQITVQQNSDLYSLNTYTYLICLKNLIELSVFKRQQSQKVQSLITKIMGNIMKSMALTGQKKFELQSKNFKELLLEMVEKNVIKKFDFSVKFDGVEDEVQEDNICSIFVNYAFYQNILLQEKDQKKTQETNLVIKVMLELIGIYSQMMLGEKFKIFIEEIMKREEVERRSHDREQFIENVVLSRILTIHKQEMETTITLLILLFYNSNSFQINYLTMNKLLQQIFANRIGLQNLNSTIFTVDETGKYEVDQLQSLYKNIKLLSETSEIWLNIQQASTNTHSKFDSVILFFMNKIKMIIRIIMPDFNENAPDPLSEIKHSKKICSEKQIILSNLNVESQVLEFLSTYRALINVVKQNKQPFNKNLLSLFKTLFLFLYIFIYESPENKKKIHSIVKEEYLPNFSKSNAKIELGQTIFIIEFLKNNYEECVDFYAKNPEMFQKNLRYTAMHSQFLLCLTNFYEEPIVANLRKFFITIFDFASFKKFLWFNNDGNQLCLDLDAELESNKEPLIYHINAFKVIIKVLNHVPEANNALRYHIRKSLPQQYLFKLLKMDDYYTKQTSDRAILKLVLHFKKKIMEIICHVYLAEDLRDEQLFFYELKRQNDLLNKFIDESPARKENVNFRKIFLMKGIKEQESFNDAKIQDLYDMNFPDENLLQVMLSSIQDFSSAYRNAAKNSENPKISQMALACDDIHEKVVKVYDILYQMPKEEQNLTYPVPYTWLLNVQASEKDEDAISRKKYTSSLILELMFNKKIYQKINDNEAVIIGNIGNILKSANLKQFSFLRKMSEFFEDVFQKLSNSEDPEVCESLKMLMQLMATWINETPDEEVNDLRTQIGKSELIFPILNYFETCKLNKMTKELFLQCLNFFNALIGIEGNKNIQSIFNQYFTNKADSLEFFMKIKQLFHEINFQDRANYKCKKIYDSIQTYSRDSQLRKVPEFILLNFLICLCKGKFRENQIFLGSLSNISNFNIMSGIWEILKYQCQKYEKNLINVENYDLITQCFSTINELVKGPCVQNQNQFLKKDFFLTVLQYFKYQPSKIDLTLEKPIENKLTEFESISHNFTSKLRVFLNSDKITFDWMPSQVKYVCISLICSLLSENQNEEGKIQLYTFPPELIVKELDKVYQRYEELGLKYTYDNMEASDESEVVLPLGYRLYQLLQYYPPQKIPESSPGIDFFKENSKIVEVLHNERISRVVFPHSPNEISEAFKAQFMEEVDRTSVNSKLRGLQQTQIEQKQSDYPYGYLLLLTISILTIVDIIMFNNPSGVPFVQYFLFLPVLRTYGYFPVLDIMASILLVLGAVLSLIFHILQIRGAISLKNHIQEVSDSQDDCWQKTKNICTLLWDNFHQFHYAFLFFLFILAAFNPFFDVIILVLELYRRSEIFSAILKAIGGTLDQLCVVLLLTLVCTYVLTAIFYYYIGDQWFPAQCETLYYCFVFSLDNGFRADAGLVGYADDEGTILEDDVTIAFQTVLLNFIYLLIIKMIIDQIVGAIMVDKFAELRENKEKIEEDQNSNCFICGLQRNLLDREENGFEIHREEYHNVWNYFEFLLYLRKMQPQNLSGIEMFVYEEQKNGGLSWFPISRSWHLEHKKKNQQGESQAEDQLEIVSKQLDNEVQILNSEVHQIWELLNVKIAKQKAQKSDKKA